MRFSSRLLNIFYFTFSLFCVFNSFAESGCKQSFTSIIARVIRTKSLPFFEQKKNQTPKASTQFASGTAYLYDKLRKVETGHNKEADWYKTAEEYETIAERGTPDAQFALGLMYFYVDGVFPRDDKKAVYWLKKAAKKGHLNAQINLVWLYYKGEEAVRNYVQAYKWLLLYKFQKKDEKPDIEIDLLLHDLESKMTKNQIAEAQKFTE